MTLAHIRQCATTGTTNNTPRKLPDHPSLSRCYLTHTRLLNSTSNPELNSCLSILSVRPPIACLRSGMQQAKNGVALAVLVVRVRRVRLLVVVVV